MSSRVSGTSTRSVRVTGVSAIQRALRPLLDPEFSKRIDVANKKGAQMYGKALKAEVRPLSKRMARAVRVKRAKTGKPGWVVGSRRKVAFFWPFVIGGTRAHGPKRAPLIVFVTPQATVRTKHVKGVPPNDAVGRVASGNEARIARELGEQYMKGTGL